MKDPFIFEGIYPCASKRVTETMVFGIQNQARLNHGPFSSNHLIRSWGGGQENNPVPFCRNTCARGNAGIKPGAKKGHGRFLYRVLPSLLRGLGPCYPQSRERGSASMLDYLLTRKHRRKILALLHSRYGAGVTPPPRLHALT